MPETLYRYVWKKSILLMLLWLCLTEFFVECETLKHALVHQGLFGSIIRDQFSSLWLELTLPLRKKRHTHTSHFTVFNSDLVSAELLVELTFFTLVNGQALTHLQVKTGTVGFIYDEVSMFESGELRNQTDHNVNKTDYSRVNGY